VSAVVQAKSTRSSSHYCS